MQTSVDSPMSIGVAGQLADEYTASNGDIGYGTNEEAATNIPFGVMVKEGTTADRIKLPTTAADVLAGILIHEYAYDVTTQLADATVNTNAQSAILPNIGGALLKRGRVLVIPEADGTDADGVHMRIVASGGNTQLGSFTPTAEVGKTVNLSSLARWRNGGPKAGQPSVLEIDLTNAALVAAD